MTIIADLRRSCASLDEFASRFGTRCHTTCCVGSRRMIAHTESTRLFALSAYGSEIGLLFADIACEPRRFRRRNPNAGGMSPLGSICCRLLLAGEAPSNLGVLPGKSASWKGSYLPCGRLIADETAEVSTQDARFPESCCRTGQAPVICSALQHSEQLPKLEATCGYLNEEAAATHNSPHAQMGNNPS
jgi:hypothetical protein